jgi:uncharacterized protein
MPEGQLMPRLRFIVDNNVGKLAVWLRALGYDALFINPIHDDDLVRIARDENRVILTKDTGVMQRRVVNSGQVRALFIEGSDWTRQLEQVVRDLHLRPGAAFTRCISCNSLLSPAARDDAIAHVPPKIIAMHKFFWYCCNCRSFFWQGSHWQRMTDVLKRVFSGT